MICQILEEISQRACRVSIPADTQNSTGWGPKQPYLGASTLSSQLGWTITRGPFQPQPCDTLLLDCLKHAVPHPRKTGRISKDDPSCFITIAFF